MQKKMEIKVIALDLDGTTFNSKGELTLRTKQAIEAAGEKGVHVVISTGRSYNSLPKNIFDVNGITYAITSNGAHIVDFTSGKTICDNYLDTSAVKAVERFSKDVKVGMEVFIDGQAYLDELTYNDIKENGTPFRNAQYILWSRKPIEDIYGLLEDNITRIENINICFDSVEQLEEHRASIEAIPHATITSSFVNNLEVGGPNTSKKSALVELLKYLDIDSSNLMCCGDAPNDIQMIEYAGLGVAMENAWGGTKDYADYVTASNDDDGVALAIEKFVL